MGSFREVPRTGSSLVGGVGILSVVGVFHVLRHENALLHLRIDAEVGHEVAVHPGAKLRSPRERVRQGRAGCSSKGAPAISPSRGSSSAMNRFPHAIASSTSGERCQRADECRSGPRRELAATERLDVDPATSLHGSTPRLATARWHRWIADSHRDPSAGRARHLASSYIRGQALTRPGRLHEQAPGSVSVQSSYVGDAIPVCHQCNIRCC